MNIQAKDCLIEGVSDGRRSFWQRATHLPTGVSVTDENPTWDQKRSLMERLQQAVNAQTADQREGD